MSIVCGIDFSEGSARAAQVAAALAAQFRQPLHLVHALGDWPLEFAGEEKAHVMGSARRALEAQAQRLASFGANVVCRVELDLAEPSLLRVAQEENAQLIVFGATGRGQGGGRACGRTADRLAQKSKVPTLVIRNADPLLQWLQQKAPLKVVIGLDFNRVSDDAWAWAVNLSKLGTVEAIGVHVYWAPFEFHRLGLDGMRSYVDPDPEVGRVLQRELESRFRLQPGSNARLRLKPAIGHPAENLLAAAAEEHADLVVVGSHQRSAVARLWEGSVSHRALQYGQGAVACIPLSLGSAARLEPSNRRVLAATDFSPAGNAAVERAYAHVGRGGTVHLVHVVTPLRERSPLEPQDIFTATTHSTATRESLEASIRALVPTSAALEDKTTEVTLLESREPAQAIVQAAERLGVDAICVGTRGQSELANRVLGSVALGVLTHTRRPVVVVHAPAP